MKTVADIGSCYGGLARRIARECPNKNVIALERMPCPMIISKVGDLFSKKSKTKWADAFEFIEKSKGYDIGVAYLLPPQMWRVEKLAHKFKVLLILDFPLPNRKSTRAIKLHKTDRMQHMLYVYEN